MINDSRVIIAIPADFKHVKPCGWRAFVQNGFALLLDGSQGPLCAEVRFVALSRSALESLR
tara:strand:- start:323 stop:505 length:183 start_codon:yes stop_codon:yes gene_type:complete